MIIIFDLDETLYNEITFVRSGFLSVSSYISKKFNIKKKIIFKKLQYFLKVYGRGKVFNYLCADLKIKCSIKKLINIYRSHNPKISIRKDSIYILKYLSSYNKYIITDGKYSVQKKKIKALKIKHFFKKIFYTDFYGKIYEKPSIKCFKIIKDIENISWSKIIYVADNPYKDFVNCNKRGIITVRILKGIFKNVNVKKNFDGQIKIKNLYSLKKIIKKIK